MSTVYLNFPQEACLYLLMQLFNAFGVFDPFLVGKRPYHVHKKPMPKNMSLYRGKIWTPFFNWECIKNLDAFDPFLVGKRPYHVHKKPMPNEMSIYRGKIWTPFFNRECIKNLYQKKLDSVLVIFIFIWTPLFC